MPDNVYIIGTMNTADRSIALMDTALRRRFDFVEMMPDAQLLENVVVEGIEIDLLIEKLNRRIEVLHDREHTLGHSYFWDLREERTLEKLAHIFENKILPLLQEYFFEDYEKIRMVLGDTNKKDEKTQFILKKDYMNDFSGDIDGFIDTSVYTINKEALNNIESYRNI